MSLRIGPALLSLTLLAAPAPVVAEPAEPPSAEAAEFEPALEELQAHLAAASLDDVVREEVEALAEIAEEMYVEGDAEIAWALLGEARALAAVDGA